MPGRFVMRRMGLSLAMAAMTGWAAGAPPVALAASAPGTQQIKAALTYRFAQFVTVPGHAAGAPLDLCVVRQDPMEPSLQLLRGRLVGTAPLRIRVVDGTVGGFRGCHIAYLGEGGGAAIEQITRMGILTIGEGEQFVRRGGVIGMVRFGRQMRFLINYRVAESSGLKVSSKLLQLAVQVIA